VAKVPRSVVRTSAIGIPCDRSRLRVVRNYDPAVVVASRFPLRRHPPAKSSVKTRRLHAASRPNWPPCLIIDGLYYHRGTAPLQPEAATCARILTRPDPTHRQFFRLGLSVNYPAKILCWNFFGVNLGQRRNVLWNQIHIMSCAYIRMFILHLLVTFAVYIHVFSFFCVLSITILLVNNVCSLWRYLFHHTMVVGNRRQQRNLTELNQSTVYSSFSKSQCDKLQFLISTGNQINRQS